MRRSAVAIAAVAIVLAGCTLLPPPGTKGTMPPPGANGEIDPNAVPDYVAVAGEVGVVGYVQKAAMFEPGDKSWPVYGEDLRTVVGQLAPGRGFVPAGIDPRTVPTFRVDVGPVDPRATQSPGVVRAYVRNGGTVEAWVVVITLGVIQPGGSGFPGDGYIGVGCMAVPDGSRLVLLDRSPTDAAAKATRTLYVGSATQEPASLWIDVARDGAIQVGTGMPGWWQGDPPPC